MQHDDPHIPITVNGHEFLVCPSVMDFNELARMTGTEPDYVESITWENPSYAPPPRAGVVERDQGLIPYPGQLVTVTAKAE